MGIARRMLALGTLCPGGLLAPTAERHYLPFDGSSDYALAAGAATGISSSGWTLVVKVARTSDLIINSRVAGVHDGSASHNGSITIIVSTAGAVWNYRHTSGAWDGVHAIRGSLVAASQCVLGAYHDNVGSTPAKKMHIVQAGATMGTASGNLGVGQAPRTPLHISVARDTYDADGTLQAMRLVAVALVSGEATESELQAYSTMSDARPLWGARLFAYYPASATLPNNTIQNFGVGTSVPLTLTGPVAADLVAL